MKTVFTTGAHLCPVKIGDLWHWVVSEFTDDSFLQGESINPQEYADTEEGLIQYYAEDDEPPTDAELADLEASELDLQEEE